MLLDKRYGQSFPAGLTCMPAKATLYSLDSHFWDGWEDLVDMAGQSAQGLARTHSLVLVRPDAIAARKAHLVLDWLPTHGFRLVACVPLLIDRHQVRSLWQYQWNVAPRERRDACDALMGAGPSLLLVIANEARSQEAAAPRFSKLKGAADPAMRRPGDLRAALGHKSRMLSLVHAPDEAADFVREIAIFLPERQRKALFAKMASEAAMPAAEAQAEVLAEVLALYGQVPEHALDFDAALSRVVAAADTVMGPAEAGLMQADRGAVAALSERIGAGMRTDWRELFLLLDRLHAPYAAWDRVLIAGHLAAMDAEGKQVLLDHPPAPPLSSPTSPTGTVAC